MLIDFFLDFAALHLGSRRRLTASSLGALLLFAGAARAQDATWLANPVDGVFNNSANWTPAAVPTGTAEFGNSTQTAIGFTAIPTYLGALRFNAVAPAYTFTITGNQLSLSGLGIVGNSSNTPNIIIQGPVNTLGNLVFANSASAGSANITNNNNGLINFFNTSTVGSANITNNATVYFTDSSTAGDANITNNNNGIVRFFHTSAAGSANITNNGLLQFFENSTTGSANITTNQGGTVYLEQGASGGQARFVVNAGGIFDISGLTSSGTTAGSIEGAGAFYLGSKQLTVGSNNFSTIVSGTIMDGGAFGGAGASLVKTGSGVLTLSGDNAYTGTTTINAGTLQIGNGGASGSIQGNVTNNGTLAFDRSDAVTFSGVISGNGALVQHGGGVLALNGSNSYTGATTVAAGVLQGGALNAFSSSSAFTVSTGATLDLGGYHQSIGSLSGSGTVTNNGSNAATLAVNGNSFFGGRITDGITNALGLALGGQNTTITLTGANNTFTGGAIWGAGQTVSINNANALGSGHLTMLPGATLQFTGTGYALGNDVVFQAAADPTIDSGAGVIAMSGVISGPGQLSKIGSGTLILAGSSTYTGGTDVIAGTLAVTGSLASAVTVESGANVGGSGSVGGLNALSGAFVTPGLMTPYSTLAVNGSTSFAAGSAFQVTVNAAGQNDKLTSTGATTISGGTVQVNAISGLYTPSSFYTLITAQGGVTGTFSALSTNLHLAFLSPVLSYDASDVYLGFILNPTPTPAPVNFASVAQTFNQFNTATALNAQQSGSPLYNALIGQTVAGARQAFDALSGEIHASAVSAAAEDSRLPREAVLDRLAGPYDETQPRGAGAFQASANFGAPNRGQVFQTWGQGFTSSGRLAGDGNAAPLNRWLDGFVFGADATLDSQYRFGVATAYTHSNLSDAVRGSSGRVDSTSFGFYGGTSQQALQLRGGAYYTFNRYRTSRNVEFPGFNDVDGAGYNGNTLQAFGEAGWRVGMPSYGKASWLEPFVGLLAMRLNTDNFSEQGRAAALNGASGGYGFGASTLGLRAETSLFDWAPLMARAMLGWRHVYGDASPSAVLAFASVPGIPYTVYGSPLARNAMAAELGLDWRVTKAASLGLYYSALYGSAVNDNAVKGRFDMAF